MNTVFSCMLAIALMVSCNKQTSGDNHLPEPSPVDHENYGDDPNQYPRKSSDVIRLMTYNTFYCKGNNTTDASKNGFTAENTANVAKVIAALNPDVISLQELDRNCIDRGRRDLLNEIALATGKEWDVVFAPAASYGGGNIGPGMLAKKSLGLKNLKTVGLPGNEARMVIIAEFEKFVFMATHLDLNDSKRKSSAETLVYYSNLYNGILPVFLAGDLNDSPQWSGGGAAFPTLKSTFVIKSSTASSLPGQSNTIDYILYDSNNTDVVEFIETHVVRSFLFDTNLESLDTYSDHYPVILDIKVK